jgi:hypothetical protein
MRVSRLPAAHAHVWTQASLAREIVERGGFDVAAPVIGEKQFQTPVVLGQISLRKNCERTPQRLP